MDPAPHRARRGAGERRRPSDKARKGRMSGRATAQRRGQAGCIAARNAAGTSAAGRYGGESGIRTHGRVSPTHAFQACSFNRSDISPETGGARFRPAGRAERSRRQYSSSSSWRSRFHRLTSNISPTRPPNRTNATSAMMIMGSGCRREPPRSPRQSIMGGLPLPGGRSGGPDVRFARRVLVGCQGRRLRCRSRPPGPPNGRRRRKNSYAGRPGGGASLLDVHPMRRAGRLIGSGAGDRLNPPPADPAEAAVHGGGGPRRGSDPVQFQPANRVRAGRQQR